jgi:hypothetical protein
LTCRNARIEGYRGHRAGYGRSKVLCDTWSSWVVLKADLEGNWMAPNISQVWRT